MKNNTYTAHSKTGKTVSIEGGTVRDISTDENCTICQWWPSERAYEGYIMGAKGVKGKARVFINRKCVFVGTVAEVDELESIGRFI